MNIQIGNQHLGLQPSSRQDIVYKWIWLQISYASSFTTFTVAFSLIHGSELP